MTSTSTDSIIEVRDLTKRYPPDVLAVDKITFHVARGEIFGFLGPNGAGKSTTIKVLTTLLRRNGGDVIVDGHDPEREPDAVRRTIGYAAQEVGIDDDLTGRENLRLQCRMYHLPSGQVDGRIEELLKTVDLTDGADRRAGTYSGGMRKRLDLAGSLIHRPKLLFLDEPTTGLDPQNRRGIWDYIEDLNEAGTTIFLTTQYMEEVDRLADRLCIIDHGRIVADGTPAALKSGIGADVIRIALHEDGNGSNRIAAKGALSPLAGVREIQDYDEGIVVYANSGSSLVPEIVRTLDASGVAITNLTFSAPSLDDVFLKHTGHKMRVDEVRPPSRTMMFRARRRM